MTTMAQWFTADLHLGHKGILRHRPQFLDLDQMHASIINNWNAVVTEGDEVWVLGDVAMREHALPLMDQMNGTKHLVAGNHDDCHPASHRSNPAKHMARYERHFASIHLGTVEMDDVLLCHFPYWGDHTASARFKEHRPQYTGKVLLHGHCHLAWKRWGPQVNVGVDVWDFAPVSMEEAKRDGLLGLIAGLGREAGFAEAYMAAAGL